MKVVVHPKYQWASDFIASLPCRFSQEGEMLYQGRNLVKRFEWQGHTFIVKRYKRPKLIQRLAYTFWRKSKAERAYLFADKLLSLGIDTPEGIAYMEEKEGGLFATGYFVSACCTDRPVYPELVPVADFDKQLASSLAAFFAELHGKGILHGDLNLNNILYRFNPDGTYHFSVIDTNRSVFKASLTPSECFDNLKRVAHRRDLLHFIVAEYARVRSWNVEATVAAVEKSLTRFERKRRLRGYLK